MEQVWDAIRIPTYIAASLTALATIAAAAWRAHTILGQVQAAIDRWNDSANDAEASLPLMRDIIARLEDLTVRIGENGGSTIYSQLATLQAEVVAVTTQEAAVHKDMRDEWREIIAEQIDALEAKWDADVRRLDRRLVELSFGQDEGLSTVADAALHLAERLDNDEGAA
jgi:hypothetical protein